MSDEFTDILDAAAALDAGRMSARELLAQQLSRIEQGQEALNCYVELDGTGARAAAEQSDSRRHAGRPRSPLDGIPVAVKDNIDVAGLATRNGSRHSHPVPGDAPASAALRDAGAVILGKLNMDECAIGGTTVNPQYGPSVNPWKPGFVPGGSSGGSGGAVAGGLAFAALGTDTLGSVRLPAAYCGIVGLKATRGLIDMRGIVPLSRSLDHVGPLCRSVRDTRLMFDILTGASPEYTPMDTARGLKGTRIGVLPQGWGAACDAVVAEAFQAAIEDARRSGARIVEVSMPDVDLDALRHAAFLVIEAEGADALAAPLRDHPEAYSSKLRSMLEYGRNLDPERLRGAREQLDHADTALADVFADIDFLATPTAPQTAFAITDPPPTNQAAFTGLANIYGGPAISLPCGISEAGLPLAIQLMAPLFKEHDLLNVAADLENIWGRALPPA